MKQDDISDTIDYIFLTYNEVGQINYDFKCDSICL